MREAKNLPETDRDERGRKDEEWRDEAEKKPFWWD